MLHASLIELAEQAPLCTDQATLRGVLTESHDLTRNALAHDTNAVEVAHWFSRLLTDALHSPAATELTDGRIQIVTGPFGRGEGMPTSPVEWLSILPKSVPYQYNQNLEKVLTETGFVLAPLPATLLPTTREDWEHRIDHALEHGDGEALGVYTDAGTWMAEKVLASRMAPPALLRNAVEHRPPAVQTQAGLPRKDVPIDIRRDLLSPLARLARWAAIAAGRHCLTPGAVGRASRWQRNDTGPVNAGAAGVVWGVLPGCVTGDAIDCSAPQSVKSDGYSLSTEGT